MSQLETIPFLMTILAWRVELLEQVGSEGAVLRVGGSGYLYVLDQIVDQVKIVMSKKQYCINATTTTLPTKLA